MANMNETVSLRRFILKRATDVSGVSGTGIVAEGVQFTDGTVALRWRSFISSHVIYPNAKAAESVHSHGGATKIVWLDGIAA